MASPASLETLWRLRRLQASLQDEAKAEVYLFVAGVDGRDNWASNAVLRWLLLGESGGGLLEETARPFVVPKELLATSLATKALRKHAWTDDEEARTTKAKKTAAPLVEDDDDLDEAKSQVVSEALEETVLIVAATWCVIFYDPRAESVLSPLLSAPGVTEYSLPHTALADVEAAEAHKVAAFMKMASLALETKTVGICVGRGVESAAEDVEYWPLVQAYAATRSARGAAQAAFFTQRCDVVDATRTVSKVLVSRDASALKTAVHEATNGIRRHVDETCRAICGSTFKSRLPLDATQCADRAAAFYSYGNEEGDEAEPSAGGHHTETTKDVVGAWALLGPETVKLVEAETEESKSSFPSATTFESTHVVLQVHDPQSGIRVARTYLLAGGHADADLARAVQAVSAAYSKLLDTLHHVVPDLLRRLATTEPRELEAVLSSVLGEIGGEEARVKVDCDACNHDTGVVYVRLAAQVAETSAAVCVGDTFVMASAGLGDQDEKQARRVSQGQSGLVTGERAAPYFKLIGRASGAEGARSADLLRELRDPHDSRNELELGSKRDSFAAATLLVGLVESGEEPRAVTGKLEVYETGLAILDSGLAPLILSFARGDALKITVRERQKQCLVIFDLNDKGHESRPPPLREATCAAAPALQVAVLVVQAHGEAHRVISANLMRWRGEVCAHAPDFHYEDQVPRSDDFFEALFDDLWAQQNDVLPSRMAAADAVDALVEAYAATSKRRLLDKLDAEKPRGGDEEEEEEEETARTSSAIDVGDEKYDVTALIGLPGSGVMEVAASMISRGAAEGASEAWRHVVAVVDAQGRIDVAETAERVRAAKPVGLATRDKILVSACCADSSRTLVRAVATGLDSRRALAVGVVVSAAQLNAFAQGEKQDVVAPLKWPLWLMDQCAAGYATAAIFVDGGGDAFAALNRRLRALKSPLKSIRTARGSRETSGVLDTLRAVDEQDVARKRLAAEDGGRWLCASTTDGPRLKTITVRVDYTFEHALLVKLLSLVLPQTKFSKRLLALRDLQRQKKPSEKKTTALGTLFAFAKSKVERGQDVKRREADWPAVLDAWVAKHGQNLPRLSAISGVVDVSDAGRTFDTGSKEEEAGSCLGLDANASHGSFWPVGGRESRALFLTLVAADEEARPFDERAITSLLALAATTTSKTREPRTRASVTAAEVDAVERRAMADNTPLPSGIAYDGRSFVDLYGNRTKRRPDLDHLVDLWLDAHNAGIQKLNAKVLQTA